MDKSIKLFINNVLILCLGYNIMVSDAHSQPINDAPKNILMQPQASFDDIMSITIDSKLVVDLTVKKIRKLSPEQTIGVASNKKRILIIADVQSLIRGETGINSEIKFLFDAPIDARGKIPKLKKQRFLAFGQNVPNRPDFIKLSYVDSMLPYDPSTDLAVRSAITQVIAPSAAQKITGISSAFHSPGTIIGEGETQIFLNTQFRQPMAISVVSRGSGHKNWSVSTSEVIDINAVQPQRRSLIGHRLACSLPSNIQSNIIESGNTENIRKTMADYEYVKNAIGPCVRNIRWNN